MSTEQFWSFCSTWAARILQHSELHSRPTGILENHSKRNPGDNKTKHTNYEDLHTTKPTSIPKWAQATFTNPSKLSKNQPQTDPKSIENRSKIDPSGIPRATGCKRHQIIHFQGGFIAKSASKRHPKITPKSSQKGCSGIPLEPLGAKSP